MIAEENAIAMIKAKDLVASGCLRQSSVDFNLDHFRDFLTRPPPSRFASEAN